MATYQRDAIHLLNHDGRWFTINMEMGRQRGRPSHNAIVTLKADDTNQSQYSVVRFTDRWGGVTRANSNPLPMGIYLNPWNPQNVPRDEDGNIRDHQLGVHYTDISRPIEAVIARWVNDFIDFWEAGNSTDQKRWHITDDDILFTMRVWPNRWWDILALPRDAREREFERARSGPSVAAIETIPKVGQVVDGCFRGPWLWLADYFKERQTPLAIFLTGASNAKSPIVDDCDEPLPAVVKFVHRDWTWPQVMLGAHHPNYPEDAQSSDHIITIVTAQLRKPRGSRRYVRLIYNQKTGQRLA